MSLDKAIKSGKERRDPKRKAAGSCECHGGCPYCLGNRKHSENVRKERANYKENDK